jgi:multidrug efflux pump subunit AcrB
MKKFTKILGVLLLLVVLGVIGFIAVVEFVTHRSQREVVSIVSQLAPGTAFSAAEERLGQPKQKFTNREEIESWVERVGARIDSSVAANSVLHTFVHHGPPSRYILVYTDREAQSIVYADWCHM